MNNIAPSLRSMVLPIHSLNADEKNPRRHPTRNVEAIKASLAQFGQQKPIVVQRAGMVVRAGNGTLLAARILGWTEIAANVVDMDDATAAKYAIADNRTGELAEWDPDNLAALMNGWDQTAKESVGFDKGEIDRLLAGMVPPMPADLPPLAGSLAGAPGQPGVAYRPNLEPPTDAAPSATTPADMQAAAAGMKEQFSGVQVTREVTCPDCGHTFLIGA